METGEVLRRLTSSDREPHFDALNFLETAGTWSPDGRRFAYVVVDDGDNEFRIADVAGGGGVRPLEVPDVEALNDPAWSPDGTRIAFSGSSDGISDLFYDLETERVRRFADDLHAELQPAWSPDGSTLVFATDRGPDTDLDVLSFGPLRLAALDVGSGRTELLPAFPGAKHIDPHFAPDGRSVYFVSDRDGVSDVFPLELDTGRFFRVTHTATGVSGVTAHSPALSVAAGSGRLVFSISDNRYTLHTLEPEEARGEPVSRPGDVSPAGVLPPVTAARPGGRHLVSAYIAAPAQGLPATPRYTVTDYDPSLGLDYIGPPMVGVSVDEFGTQLGGSVSVFFSDLLGNRTLGIQTQAQGELVDIGGQASTAARSSTGSWEAGLGSPASSCGCPCSAPPTSAF